MEKRLPIKLITRNSKLNDLAQSLFAVGVITLAIFYISMSPSEKSSGELQAFWFINGVPLIVKKVALYGLITLTLGFIITLINTKGRFGELLINSQTTSVILTKKTISINNDMIKEIVVSLNPELLTRNESEYIKIFIRTKTGEVIRLKLIHYLLADELMKSLQILESENIRITTSHSNPHWAD